ncbi:MAG TPA: DUF6350 family protein, partial [Candidatus Limnocylindria bacterium]|nr:DUF6350 family protein [Candidatus Limnocylindria bacterium]
MALTNDRRRRGPRAAAPARAAGRAAAAPATVRTPFGAALPAALWSAALGLAVVTVLVIVGWAAAPDTGVTTGAAVAAGGQAWLLAQGADLTLPDGVITLTPLGLLLLPGFVLVRSGRWAARAADVRSWADAARTVGLIALLYALIGLGVAFAAATPVVRPQPWTAFVGTGLVALLASGWGVLRASGLAAAVPAALPRQAVPVLRGAAGGLAVLIAGGGLFVAVSLLVHGGQVGGLWSGLGLDPAGAALLLLLSCALIPNAILWACAYVVGPGFAVGVGTSVAPT